MTVHDPKRTCKIIEQERTPGIERYAFMQDRAAGS